jgi:hypothetical protein
VGPLDILVAEDHEINRRYVGTLLSRMGHHVRFALNGEEAVAEACRQQPDLVLMDVHMPGMDGLAATRALRGQPAPLGQVKIVALTADAMSMTREQVRAAGMDDLITKPFRADALAQLLAGTAAQRSTAPTSPPSEPEPLAALLDPDTVREMLGLLSPEGYAPLVQAFFNDEAARSELDAMLRAGERGAELKRAAHRMKGAAQVLGLRGMAELTLGFEALAQGITPEQGAQAAAQLAQTWQASLAQCRSLGLIP